MTIPNEWQEACIVSYGVKPSDDGDPNRTQFAIEFETAHGKITWYGGFSTDKATEYTLKTLQKCGGTGFDLNAMKLTPAPLRILVEEDTYNGKTRQKVKAVSAGGGKAVDPAAAKSASAALAARIKAAQSRLSGTEPPMFAADDEDVSFP